MATTLEDSKIPWLTSVGQMTVAELAALMLKLAKVDYRFDAAGSDRRVQAQAGGLAWEGPLLRNLDVLAALMGLKVEIEDNLVRFIKTTEERREDYHLFE